MITGAGALGRSRLEIQHRRRFLSAIGAMLAAESPFDPEIDSIYTRYGLVEPAAISDLAGSDPFFPVWLHEGRITINRYRQGTPDQENDRGAVERVYRF